MQICKLTQNPTILVDIFILDILLIQYFLRFTLHAQCRIMNYEIDRDIRRFKM